MIVLIPIWWKDVERVKDTIVCLKQHIDVERIILVGPEAMRQYVPTDELVEYVDGNTIIPGMSRETIDVVITDMQKKAGFSIDTCRSGWLLQQFIKLGFSLYSDVEEYFVWDADVLMINDFELKSDGNPKFFLYDKHLHVEYLPTITKLLGKDLKPLGTYTFVNHYMLFESKIVREMINEIENNGTIDGKTWWEKCVRAIKVEELTQSGFSEFETYGEYVGARYPAYYEFEYSYRHLLSTKRYFGDDVSEEVRKWISQDYYSIGFEGYDSPDDYWMKKTKEAYKKGKHFVRVEEADIRWQKIKGYLTRFKKL